MTRRFGGLLCFLLLLPFLVLVQGFDLVTNDEGSGRTTRKPTYSSDIKSSVRFYLFSNQDIHPATGQMVGSEEIHYKQHNSLRKSGYMKQLPLKILIHGYKRTGFSLFPHIVKDAYIQRDNHTNVICVDWRVLASDFIYATSAYNTRIAGERIGEFLMFLKEVKYLRDFKDVHIVGFSLGAQVAGFAGKYVHAASYRKVKVGRITGLDPAGPRFFRADSKNRLDKEDADFTDVIHTSAGASGICSSIGHVDFFPNGGTDQPGCELEKLLDPFLQNCSHERSLDLFEQSIRGVKFYGCLCASARDFEHKLCDCVKRRNRNSSMALMGEYASHSIRGDYFFNTGGSKPYIKVTGVVDGWK